MTTTWHADSATLVADLNDLIQLDRDAIETYTVAINSLMDDVRREILVGFRADHHRHAEALAAAVRARGAMAIELPHITGPFKMAVQAMGGAVGMATRRDANVLLALRVVEGQVRDKYTRYAGKSWPADIASIVADAAADEVRHYAWLTSQLRELGYGDQSLAGSVGAAAEALHTLVANPIEAVARQVMQFVEQTRPDRLMGTMGMGRRPQTSPIVEGFRNALKALETDGTIDWMVTLFDPSATLSSPRSPNPEQGADAARRFWTGYRAAFPSVTTTIDSASEAPGVATLNWTSRANVDGVDTTWRGITVLEHTGGRITRLLQLYDTAQLVPPVATV